MLKFALKDARRFLKSSESPILGKFVAFRLDSLAGLDDPKIASEIYTRHLVSEGTTKETAPGRFRDLEESTSRFLVEGNHKIHDVAVSSGITSVELFECLKARGAKFELSVSDKFSRYYCRGNLNRRIYGVDKQLLQAYFLGILADWKVSWKFPLSKILIRIISMLDRPQTALEVIMLYDPKLVRLIRSGTVGELEYDLFTTRITNRFTFVRCMNVLNLAYFPQGKITQAMKLLADSLEPGGILFLGRTVDQKYNTATYYRKSGAGQLEPVLDINGGSELKSLVEGLQTA